MLNCKIKEVAKATPFSFAQKTVNADRDNGCIPAIRNMSKRVARRAAASVGDCFVKVCTGLIDRSKAICRNTQYKLTTPSTSGCRVVNVRLSRRQDASAALCGAERENPFGKTSAKGVLLYFFSFCFTVLKYTEKNGIMVSTYRGGALCLRHCRGWTAGCGKGI